MTKEKLVIEVLVEMELEDAEKLALILDMARHNENAARSWDISRDMPTVRIRKRNEAKAPEWLNEALNSGDGVYRP